jgi:flagellar hook-associated protein 2
MTSSIQLGTLATGTGAPRLMGSSSKLDTEALLQAMVDAKRLPAMRLEKRIDRDEARLAALEDMRALLGQLRQAVDRLRNPPGSLGVQDNLFERKMAFLTSDGPVAAEQIVGVSVANAAAAGRFDLVVEQLARARKLAADSVDDPSAPLADSMNGGAAFAGSFEIGLEGSGTSATIEVTGEMTLNDLRARINNSSAESGVSAQVLKVADGDHRLVLTATETGKEVVLTPAGGDDVLAVTGLSADGGATFKNSLQEPQLARFEIDGVALERTGNTVTDAIPGVTLSLYRGEPGTTVTVEVEHALGEIKEGIGAFVEAYNAFRDLVDQNRRVDESGRLGEDAALFGNSLLRSVTGALGSELGRAVAGLPEDALATLGAIGITLDSTSRLKVDDGKLDESLLGKLDEVRDIFEFSLTSDTGELRVIKRTNALAEHSFTLNIVDADADGVIDSADIDGVPVDVDGRRIIGKAGTPFEGLELFWSGTGSGSIEVTATQGIADRLYNQLEGVLRPGSGRLQAEVDSIDKRNDDARRQIERIDERAERYRARLIERFAAMEAALAMADAMMRHMRTQMDAMFQKN